MKVETWLREMWSAQTEKMETIKAACTLLAGVPIKTAPITDTSDIHVPHLAHSTSAVYPYPATPESPVLRETWEGDCLKQAAHRTAVATLFADSPTRTAATTGSLWGAYQAVVEYEDYGRPRSQAASRFMGAGSLRKEKSVCHVHVPSHPKPRRHL